MFKFNFQLQESEDLSTATDDHKSNSHGDSDVGVCRPTQKDSALNWRHFTNHVIEIPHLEFSENSQFQEIKLEETKKLKYIRIEAVDHTIQDACPTEHQHSDLVPAIYEGGFKIWECTWDMLNLITEYKHQFKGKRVLELGCGAGLLGIAAAFYGASCVAFQDYNEEVINRLTIPNVILNFPNLSDQILNCSKTATDKCEKPEFKFYSGDWGSLPEGILSDSVNTSSVERDNELQFDIILTSETIYNPDNHSKLVDVFDTCLKTNGVVFVGAKNYYFGVGGGTHDFIRVVSQEKKFKVSTKVCHNEDVLREIIEINKV